MNDANEPAESIPLATSSPDNVNSMNIVDIVCGGNDRPSPVCKDSFTFDGKEVSFDKDPWYVGWLFQTLDATKKSVEHLSDMVAGYEKYKFETDSKIEQIQAQQDIDKEKIASLEAELAAMKIEKDEMKEQVESLRSATDDRFLANERNTHYVFRKSDELEQYSSRECLIIHGIPEEKTKDQRMNEDTDKKFMEAVNTKLGVSISMADIDRSHRLGKFADGQNRPRPIIAKLARHNIKSMIYRKKKLLKNSGVMITERLTQRRLRFLRYAKSKYGNFNAWTNDGEILVKTEGVIRNMTSEFYDFEQDILNYLIQPVQNGQPEPMK